MLRVFVTTIYIYGYGYKTHRKTQFISLPMHPCLVTRRKTQGKYHQRFQVPRRTSNCLMCSGVCKTRRARTAEGVREVP
jgi:hypothetical protein